MNLNWNKPLIIKFGRPVRILIPILIVFLLNSCKKIDVSPDLDKSFIKYYGGKSNEISSKMLQLDEGAFVLIGTSSSINDTSDAYLVKTDQKGNKIWEKYFGGSGPDTGIVVKKSIDNELLILATKYDKSTQVASIYIAKVNNAQGSLIWQNTIQNGSKSTYAYDMSVGKDGSIYVIGGTDTLTQNTGIVKNVYIRKLKADGSKDIDIPTLGLDSRNNLAKNIIENSNTQISALFNTSVSLQADGNFQIQPSPLFAKIRLDVGSAILQVNKSSPQINEFAIQNANQIKKTADDGYIATGYCIKNGVNNLYLLKLDSDFNKIDNKGWFEFYQSEGVSEGFNVIQCKDGGYVACGTTFTNRSGADILIVRASATGELIFSKSFGGTGLDYANDIIETEDGGFAILCTIELTNTPQNRQVMSLLKITSNGEIKN